MAGKKKKAPKKDDVDPRILRKIKEPRVDLLDDIEAETLNEEPGDEEKTGDSDEETA